MEARRNAVNVSRVEAANAAEYAWTADPCSKTSGQKMAHVAHLRAVTGRERGHWRKINVPEPVKMGHPPRAIVEAE